MEACDDQIAAYVEKEKDLIEYGNCRGIAVVTHTGKVLLKMVARRLSNHCEENRLLPEEQCGFRPERSTTDMMLVMRRLQELTRDRKTPLYACFFDL